MVGADAGNQPFPSRGVLPYKNAYMSIYALHDLQLEASRAKQPQVPRGQVVRGEQTKYRVVRAVTRPNRIPF